MLDSSGEEAGDWSHDNAWNRPAGRHSRRPRHDPPAGSSGLAYRGSSDVRLHRAVEPITFGLERLDDVVLIRRVGAAAVAQPELAGRQLERSRR